MDIPTAADGALYRVIPTLPRAPRRYYRLCGSSPICRGGCSLAGNRERTHTTGMLDDLATSTGAPGSPNGASSPLAMARAGRADGRGDAQWRMRLDHPRAVASQRF